MLNCVYHPIDEMQVVDNEERDRLLATGVWFDHPLKAKEYREKIEKELQQESEPKKAKAKKEGKDDEKRSQV